MIKQSLELGLSFNFMRGFFKESINRPLVDLTLDIERFHRVYVIESDGSTLITTEIPSLVPDYTNPIYLVDIPRNFRHIPIAYVIEHSKVSFVYSTKDLVNRGFSIANGTPMPTKPLMGYEQNKECNTNSSFIIGIVCGLLMQDKESDNVIP